MKKRIIIPQDDPITQRLNDGPRGKADWPGWSEVYDMLSRASKAMGDSPHVRMSDAHIDVMADMVSGHEERMKYRLMWLRTYGWIKPVYPKK